MLERGKREKEGEKGRESDVSDVSSRRSNCDYSAVSGKRYAPARDEGLFDFPYDAARIVD